MGTPANAEPIRILTNTRWFEHRRVSGRPIAAAPIPHGGLLADVRTFIRALRWDAIVLNIDPRRLLLFCLLRRLLGGRGPRLVSVDLLLSAPRSRRERLVVRLKSWLLREVDLFLCYFKDTEGMRQAYGLAASRFVYVPFKINNFARVRAMHPSDEGFALVCGRTDRDYATLAAALTGTDVDVVILEYSGADRTQHGTSASSVALPPNVRVISHDGDTHTWLDWISRASFVVLPIIPSVLKPSGISTYLEAMGLGKCVIITESPATRGLIDRGQAIVVPPRDPAVLREAILRVARDSRLRAHVAAAGRAYSLSLGDESRLADDVGREVVRLLGLEDRAGEGAGSGSARAPAHSGAPGSPASSAVAAHFR